MKKTYQKPKAELLRITEELSLLNFTAGTTDPKEGGDPTGGAGAEVDPWTNEDVDIPW